MPRQIRFKQRWYNVRCQCDTHENGRTCRFGDDERDFQLKYNTSKRLLIVKIRCRGCGNYHWLYDVNASDKIFNDKDEFESYLYIDKGVTRMSGVGKASLGVITSDMLSKVTVE